MLATLCRAGRGAAAGGGGGAAAAGCLDALLSLRLALLLPT